MKLVKSLLLGTAAGLAAVAGAQAADLPFRKAAPVDYVRVCDWVGQAGYFYIPGTDTCIKIGGEVRFEYAYVEPTRSFQPLPFGGGNTNYVSGVPGKGTRIGQYTPGVAKSSSGFFTRGKIETDVRTQTAYGLLRAFVRLQADRTAGNYNGSPNFANGSATSSTYLDKGYITFAGITAGRVQSFFDFYADDYNYDGIANSDESTQVLAYTATFGGGFSATISAEEPNGARRDGIGTIAIGNTRVALPGAGATGVQVNYAGERFPDAVAQINLQQAWGSVQLSGAYHDVNTIAQTSVATAGYQTATESGFAVQLGVDIKLPMLAAGDELWLEGAYQNGAYLYQDSGPSLNNGFYGSIVGGFQHPTVDAVAIGNTAAGGARLGTGYHLALGEGFSVMGALHHYFTPQFHDVLYGSYEEIGYGNEAKNIDWTRGGVGDGSEYRIGNQFIFTPVHNLDLGVDVMYSKINQTLGHEKGTTATPLPAGIALNPDAFTVRLRIDRNF